MRRASVGLPKGCPLAIRKGFAKPFSKGYRRALEGIEKPYQSEKKGFPKPFAKGSEPPSEALRKPYSRASEALCKGVGFPFGSPSEALQKVFGNPSLNTRYWIVNHVGESVRTGPAVELSTPNKNGCFRLLCA